jgi:hypothetical protein
MQVVDVVLSVDHRADAADVCHVGELPRARG